MKTRTIVRNAVAVAAAAGAGVALSAVAASASTSASTFHGHPSLTPMTGPRSHDQRFTELHNSAVTELAFAQRIHGRTEVLTEQGSPRRVGISSMAFVWQQVELPAA